MRVRIGRVGRPHGLDGAFFVEQPSDDDRWWKTGARFLAGRAGGRGRSRTGAVGPAGDQARPRRRARHDPRGPARGAAADRGGRVLRVPARRARGGGGGRACLGSVKVVVRGSRTTCSSSTPACCCRWWRTCILTVDLEAGRIMVAAGFAELILAARCLHARSARLRLADRAAAGRDRARRRARPAALLLSRHTPLRNGQVDDEPYGGGAGMVLRVDVVAAALDAVYGGRPAHPVVALSPQGRQLTQEVVEELAASEHLTLLSARFEGFDERIVEHLARTRSRSARTCSRTATCRRWCWSTRSRAGFRAR